VWCGTRARYQQRSSICGSAAWLARCKAPAELLRRCSGDLCQHQKLCHAPLNTANLAPCPLVCPQPVGSLLHAAKPSNSSSATADRRPVCARAMHAIQQCLCPLYVSHCLCRPNACHHAPCVPLKTTSAHLARACPAECQREWQG
jgi:hypothetical protein